MFDCLIPARGGSKGIPNKNIYPVNGHPLIAYSILAARLIDDIEIVYVSTDSVEIAEISQRYGAVVPFMRPDFLGGDNVVDREVFCHFYKNCKRKTAGLE